LLVQDVLEAFIGWLTEAQHRLNIDPRSSWLAISPIIGEATVLDDGQKGVGSTDLWGGCT
jgi:hypothetical protein